MLNKWGLCFREGGGIWELGQVICKATRWKSLKITVQLVRVIAGHGLGGRGTAAGKPGKRKYGMVRACEDTTGSASWLVTEDGRMRGMGEVCWPQSPGQPNVETFRGLRSKPSEMRSFVHALEQEEQETLQGSGPEKHFCSGQCRASRTLTTCWKEHYLGLLGGQGFTCRLYKG